MNVSERREEICPRHPERAKRLRCQRYAIPVCDHPDCARCLHPYSLCDFRQNCEIWRFDPSEKK